WKAARTESATQSADREDDGYHTEYEDPPSEDGYHTEYEDPPPEMKNSGDISFSSDDEEDSTEEGLSRIDLRSREKKPQATENEEYLMRLGGDKAVLDRLIADWTKRNQEQLDKIAKLDRQLETASEDDHKELLDQLNQANGRLKPKPDMTVVKRMTITERIDRLEQPSQAAPPAPPPPPVPPHPPPPP